MTCNCGRPTRDDAYVCETCLSGLFRALGEVPWLARELDITIAKQRAAGSTDGGRSSEKPLPFHVGASDARVALRQAMFTWIKFCTEENIRHRDGRNGWPVDNLPAMSRWLMCRVDGLAFSDLGFDACEEITNAIANCRRVIDRPADLRFYGVCPECQTHIYARPGRATITCRTCNGTYDSEEMIAWMKERVKGTLFTTTEAADLFKRHLLLPVTDRTLRNWATRGLLVAHGSRRKGAPTYLFDDMLRLIEARADTTDAPA